LNLEIFVNRLSQPVEKMFNLLLKINRLMCAKFLPRLVDPQKSVDPLKVNLAGLLRGLIFDNFHFGFFLSGLCFQKAMFLVLEGFVSESLL
jgi:hypothetical protein